MACPLEFALDLDRLNGPARLAFKAAEFAHAAEAGPDAGEYHFLAAGRTDGSFLIRHAPFSHGAFD